MRNENKMDWRGFQSQKNNNCLENPIQPQMEHMTCKIKQVWPSKTMHMPKNTGNRTITYEW
jgi:hypothetical protein